MSNDNYVMVYGSLKQGFHNHDVIAFDFDNHTRNKGYDYHGKVKTLDKFTMFDMGSFPAIMFDEDGYVVSGELYGVDNATLDLLDTLEGYPSLYNRKKVKLDVGVEAWIYFMEEEPEYAERYDIEGTVYDWQHG